MLRRRRPTKLCRDGQARHADVARLAAIALDADLLVSQKRAFRSVTLHQVEECGAAVEVMNALALHSHGKRQAEIGQSFLTLFDSRTTFFSTEANIYSDARQLLISNTTQIV